MARHSDNYKTRVRWVNIWFLLLGGLLLGRLFFIQVVEHDNYKVQAERQYTSYKSKASIAVRGNIYFKEKDSQLISAATTKEGYQIAVNPGLIEDAESMCKKAEGIVPLDIKNCVERSQKTDDPFEVIAHKIGVSAAQKIKDLEIIGLDAYPEQWRFNPGNELSSHVLGFVGYSGHELIGNYGVEQYYEDILKGKKESLETGDSFAALFLDLGKELLGSEVYNGHDIILTIEPRVQSVLENRLEEIKEKWDVESCGGIVMDPRTGAVIAMASKPDFDPNSYNTVEDISVFRNPLVSDLFELGSVVKPLTVAAGLDTEKIAPSTTYVDHGFVMIEGSRIENYDAKARGKVDMQEVLNKSLNTGAVYIMRQLGKTDFRTYMTNFGLDEKTGVDLSDEVSGNLANLYSPREIEYATASFGQGIAVTPIGFTSAVASLANEGVVMRPYVVEKVIVEGGADHEVAPKKRGRAIAKSTADEITRMLVRVVDEALLGGTVKLDRYSIAAKTGTAQIPKESGDGYYEEDYVHSFFGYAPAFDSRFVVFLYAKKPQGVRYASQTLTHPFMDLMKFLLNYYEVPPDR
jgi:cell division protein FtsI/penicillin-binding protein 2